MPPLPVQGRHGGSKCCVSPVSPGVMESVPGYDRERLRKNPGKDPDRLWEGMRNGRFAVVPRYTLTENGDLVMIIR